MSAPTVSVVIPTHHRPLLMRAALESVVAQDYAGRVEIVVVFDDGAVDVPDLRLPPGWTVRGLANGRTRGLAGARNTGILAASHELVAFLDDDDRWLSGKLTAQVRLLEDHPEARLVATAASFDDGRRLHDRLAPSACVTHAMLVRNRLAAMHSSSFLFRRDALIDELRLIDEDLPGGYGEDTDVLLRASALAPIPVVNAPLVQVRWQGDSYFSCHWDRSVEGLQYLLRKHADVAGSRSGGARMRSQIAFGLAASGRRRAALALAIRVVLRRPTAARAWLAIGVSLGWVSPRTITILARRCGRGI